MQRIAVLVAVSGALAGCAQEPPAEVIGAMLAESIAAQPRLPESPPGPAKSYRFGCTPEGDRWFRMLEGMTPSERSMLLGLVRPPVLPARCFS